MMNIGARRISQRSDDFRIRHLADSSRNLRLGRVAVAVRMTISSRLPEVQKMVLFWIIDILYGGKLPSAPCPLCNMHGETLKLTMYSAQNPETTV